MEKGSWGGRVEPNQEMGAGSVALRDVWVGVGVLCYPISSKKMKLFQLPLNKGSGAWTLLVHCPTVALQE